MASNQEDQALGYWVKGSPYLIKPKGRSYFLIPGDQPPKIKKCDAVIGVYFEKEGTKMHSKKNECKVFIEGRRMWSESQVTYDPKKFRILRGVSTPPSKWAAKIPRQIRNFDISTLICGVGGEIEVLLGSGRKKSECTLYGRKIATSLIKVAATRIFTDPLQSVMEPIANSIDAYYPERRIGKFGMGFFSLLYWLVSGKDSSLEIVSYSPGETYKASLKYKDQKLLLDYDFIEESKVPSSGTLITLTIKGHQSDTFWYLSEYIERFFQVQGINLVASWKKTKDLPKSKDPVIGFSYSSNLHQKTMILTFEDFATGIPIEVLFTSLLVPSISTKQIVGGGPKISKALPSRVINKNASDPGGDSTSHEFLITIGDVVIFKTSKRDQSPEIWRAILSLSPNTKLPVSRDDFILDASSRGEVITGMSIIAPYFKNLATLETMVKRYSEQTVQENREVMEEALATYREKLTLVPGEFLWLYEALDPSVIGSEHYSIAKLEKWVEKHYSKQNALRKGKNGMIWKGVRVFFTSLPKPHGTTFAGTNTYFFVHESATKETNWQSRIEASLTQRRLFPYPSESSKIQSVEQENEALLTAFIGSIKAIEIWFTVMPRDWKSQADAFAKHILGKYPDHYYVIISALIARISKADPEYVYGSEKRVIYFYYPSDSQEDFFPASEGKALLLAVDDFVWKAKYDYHRDLLSIIPKSPFMPSSLTSTLRAPLPSSFLVYTLSLWILEKTLGSTHLDQNAKNIIYKQIVADVSSHLLSILHNEFMLAYFLGQAPVMTSSNIGILDLILTKTRVRVNSLIKQDQSQKAVTLVKSKGEIIGEFKTSALIDTIFTIPYGNLGFYRKIAPRVPPLKLQIFSIAVNEATTKPFEEAVVTETFQNSVDAIRATKKPGKIDFIASFDPSKENRVFYSIYDPVGMTEEQFFHLGIPFLSSKTPSELQTGEMGTGFFNVYRRSTEVRIETSINPGEALLSIDTPIRSDGRVQDLHRKLWKTTNTVKGTKITIYVDHGSKEEALESLGSFKSYIEGPIRTSPLPDISMTLNGNLLPSFGGKIVFETDKYEIYYSLDSVDEFVPQLTTKGIPAGSLLPYIKDKNAGYYVGIVVNLKDKAYTPVHSRSKVNFGMDVEDFMNKVHFLAALKYQMKTSFVLDHTRSMQNVSHLMLLDSGSASWKYAALEEFQRYPFQQAQEYKKGQKYNSDEENVTLVSLINNLILDYGDLIPGIAISTEIKDAAVEEGPNNTKAFKRLSVIRNRDLKRIIASILIMWFADKNRDASKAHASLSPEEVSKEDIRTEIPANVSSFMIVFCEVYATYLARYFKVKKGLKVSVKGWIPKDPQGQYDQTTNTIELFIKEDLIEKASRSIKKLVSHADPSRAYLEISNEFWDDFFSSADSTLSHELEHYRRASSHMSLASHTSLEEDLFGVTMLRNFAQSHLTIKSRFIAEGLWDEVKKKYMKK